MRFLVFDYSSFWSTEPYYFNASLRNIGIESNLWNNSISLYDNFDTYQPDIFISHAFSLPKDLIPYIKDNKDKQIKLALSVNDVNENNIDLLVDKLNNGNIEFLLFGKNSISVNNAKFVKIIPSADLFIPFSEKRFDINKAIFVSEENQIPSECDEVYHLFTNNGALKEKVDVFLPILELNRVFVNYQEIVFKDVSFLDSQIVFDAIKSGAKITFDFNNNKDTDKINDIFKGEKFISSLKNRHTCFHRLKTLLSQLNVDEEIITRINDRISNI